MNNASNRQAVRPQMHPKSIAKIILGISFIALLAAVGTYFSVTKKLGLEYRNTDYGFSVALPETWRGYSVTIDKWTGNATGDQLGDVAFTDGPVVSIHNPKWTAEVLYQDIPVMVFTLAQWNLLQQDKFHIGAAPINPSELGRNAKYVFALPARYNYAYPPGYEEVNQIIQSKPLKTF